MATVVLLRPVAGWGQIFLKNFKSKWKFETLNLATGWQCLFAHTQYLKFQLEQLNITRGFLGEAHLKDEAMLKLI